MSVSNVVSLNSRNICDSDYNKWLVALVETFQCYDFHNSDCNVMWTRNMESFVRSILIFWKSASYIYVHGKVVQCCCMLLEYKLITRNLMIFNFFFFNIKLELLQLFSTFFVRVLIYHLCSQCWSFLMAVCVVKCHRGLFRCSGHALEIFMTVVCCPIPDRDQGGVERQHLVLRIRRWENEERGRTTQEKRPKVREVWCHQDVPEATGIFRGCKGSERKKTHCHFILNSHFLLVSLAEFRQMLTSFLKRVSGKVKECAVRVGEG